MPRVLISVSDKTGLEEFARDLAGLGWELVASASTAKALADARLPVTYVEQVTGLPEMLGGRVKTLHPAIHAAILARDTDSDRAELERFGYKPIDMVICNLYPFKETISKPGVTLEEAVEQIDIGGVTLLRAAAKNFARVLVICDPGDYSRVGKILREGRGFSPELRMEFAARAFAHTCEYDAMITAYLGSITQDEETGHGDSPDSLLLNLDDAERLRYGENPHQQGVYYAIPGGAGPLGGELIGGEKQVSYNNLLDLDAAWRAVELFDAPTVVIVKHLNPCGIGSANSLDTAYKLALASDPVSAFGGVIAANGTVDEAFIEAIGLHFVEAIAAPDFTPGALDLLARKKKNCRLLKIKPLPAPQRFEFRSVRGGVLAQTLDQGDPQTTEWRVVSKREPTSREMKALRFAWKACQAVKSNAIVLAAALDHPQLATVGIGGGLPSRVDSARLAALKAGERARGAVMASDAFFPFADGLRVGIEAGITAAIEPGGSTRDSEVIDAADEAGITLVFTGVRHFRH